MPVAQPIELDASDTTDPELGRIDFSWEYPDKDLEILDGGQGQALRAQFLKPGVYPFTLKAKDVSGNEVTIVREVSAYGKDGFTSFSGDVLESYWTAENLEARSNSIGGASYSFDEESGSLRVQLQRGTNRSLTGSNPKYAALVRDVPKKTDWTFQTKVGLRTLQFGSFHTGLLVETEESGQFRRYFFGLDGGQSLSVKRVGTGSAQTLKTGSYNFGEVRIRVKHRVGGLEFEWQNEMEHWQNLHTVNLSGNPETLRVGLHLSTSNAGESVGVSFDYAMLIDPALESPLRGKLRISEIAYAPTGGSDEEFIEFVNVSESSIELDGVKLVDGAPVGEFTFGQKTLGAGERIVVAANQAALLSAHGGSISNRLAGEWGDGKLSNGGENITVLDKDGNLVLAFNYDNNNGWPGRADGKGSTLEVIDPAADLANPENWRSSSEYGGTPGSAGEGPAVSISINEVLAHTDVPVLDTIELHNPTDQIVDISHWYLTDSSDNWKKFQIPSNTTLAAGAFKTFDEKDFNPNGLWNPNPGNRGPNEFTFSSKGDSAWIVQADASGKLQRFIDKVSFGASVNGVSFGRHTNSRQEVFFTAQTEPTLGEVNSGPRVGPVVISEIMYHPEPGDMEWIELQNISEGEVPLFNSVETSNTWRVSGIGFSFPPGITLEKRGMVILVNGDPEVFRLKHSIEEEVLIFGPYTGNLQDSGERIDLELPDNPELGTTSSPYVLVDSVRYNDKAPWPAEGDGYGYSIVRTNVDRFGTDPSHWQASDDKGGTPGKSFLPPPEPVIKVAGGRTIEVPVGTIYEDAGATATDDKDGDVSAGITIDASATDTSRTGSFKVWYTVSDEDGNVASKHRTVNVVPNISPPSYLAHRYDFSGAGKTLEDQVGELDATIAGGAKLSGLGYLSLDGVNDYVEFPDGIISKLTDATFETWVDWKGPSTSQWQRIFEFGDDNFNYLYLTPRSSSSTTPVRFAFALNSGEKRLNGSTTIPSDGETTTHFAISYDDTGDKAYLYVNGELSGSRSTTSSLSILNDTNNWLGKSQYAGRVPYFKGTFHEFRIYKRALDVAEVQSSYQAGPSKASGPVVSAFTSDLPKVSVGSSTKLTWDITDATTLTLDNGIGDVTGEVEFTVSPSQTTTYNLTTANSAGTVTIPFTIVVDNSGDPDTDSDGDGWSDGEEAILGTNPQDPSDAFDIQMSLGNADIELRWMSVSGRTYTVESSNDLNSWTQAITIGGDDTEKSYSTSTTDELRFFRLVIE